MPIPLGYSYLNATRMPEANWQGASKYCHPLQGRVVVEMAASEKKKGVILLPDTLQAEISPDIGVVLAIGRDDPKNPFTIEAGDVVVVRPGDGTWRRKVVFGPAEDGYNSGRARVRFYGVYVPAILPGHPENPPWWDSIVAKIDRETGRVIPCGRNLLIKLDPWITKSGSFDLPEDEWHRSSHATILEHGPLCLESRAGQRIIYGPQTILDLKMSEFGDDLAILHEAGVETSDVEIEGV